MSKIKMHMALKAAIIRDQQGYVGFDDPDFEKNLAKELGVSLWTVQEYRRKNFGKVQEKLSGPPRQYQTEDLSGYIIRLLEDQEVLEAKIKALERRVQDGFNIVVDAINDHASKLEDSQKLVMKMSDPTVTMGD